MKITKHWLEGVDRAPTKKMGGEIEPTIIVMHYTAGWTTRGDVATLSTSDRPASAHLVVGRQGEVFQIVPFNMKAWHAGPSRFNGKSDVNVRSIGIEISNAGWIKQLTNGNFQDQYGQTIRPDGQFVGQKRKTFTPPSEWHQEYHPRLARGEYAWEPFYEPQLKILDELTALLIETYDIQHIVSHEEIDTRGWKTDPGPMFPMRRYTKLLDDRSTRIDPLLVVTASELNLRDNPSPEKTRVLAVLKRGTTLRVISEYETWALVRVDVPGGAEGWVNTYYTEKI